YVMILSTFVLYPLAGVSFLPQKWSEFLMVALGILAGRGLQISIERLPRQPSRFLVLALLLIFIPSPLTWSHLTDDELASGARDQQLVAVAREIVSACEAVAGQQAFTALSTPPLAYVLPDVSQWGLYIAPNIHYATPLAQHKLRAAQVEQLGSADTPAGLSGMVREMGINLLVLGTGEDAFTLEVDQEPRASSLLSGASRQSIVVRIPTHLLAAPYFARVYDNGQSSAFLVLSGEAAPVAASDCRLLIPID
ncbi:MAG TPA: hypothetical protein VFH29_03555, partial [Anaerolineales bacterium]|nr:hypothetical protein [Anaerolineales bacterium]